MNDENYILTIAIDKYKGDDFKVLNNAKHDEKAFSKILCSKYGYKPILDPLFHKEATRE